MKRASVSVVRGGTERSEVGRVGEGHEPAPASTPIRYIPSLLTPNPRPVTQTSLPAPYTRHQSARANWTVEGVSGREQGSERMGVGAVVSGANKVSGTSGVWVSERSERW